MCLAQVVQQPEVAAEEKGLQVVPDLDQLHLPSVDNPQVSVHSIVLQLLLFHE